MTVEVFEPAPLYDIQGIGPYAIPHPYAAGAIVVRVIDGDTVIDLAASGYSIAPAESDVRGDVTLTAEVAAAHNGAQLYIERLTIDEQGWVGMFGERERGLESQLDHTVMSLQELRAGVARSIRATQPVKPFVPVPGAAIIIGPDGSPVSGPTAAAITDAEANAIRAEAAADRADQRAADFLNNVSAAATTAPTGQPASAEFDPETQVFSFVLPEGPEGAAGPDGPQGPAGPQGVEGPQGTQGHEGPMGPAGPVGPEGPQGTGVSILGSLPNTGALPPAGNPGDGYIIGENLWVWSQNTSTWINAGVVRGPQGSQGPQGPRGLTGTAGAQGAVGPQGATGPQGPKGDHGDPGLSFGIGGSAATAPINNIDNITTGGIYNMFATTVAGTPLASRPFGSADNHGTTIFSGAPGASYRSQIAVRSTDNAMAFRRDRVTGWQEWRHVMHTEAHGNIPWGAGHITPEWRGGRDIQIIYGDDEADKLKPIMCLQRKVSVSAAGTPNSSVLLGWFQGEILPGVTTPYQGMRGFMVNRGSNNDAVMWAGRTSNQSVNGMSCGVYGGAGMDAVGTRSTMGLEGHIYVNGPGITTAPRDGSGNDWATAIHLYSDSLVAPAHYGALIGSNGDNPARYGFWNGIGINGSAFSHAGVGTGIVGTVGINMSWLSAYADIGIKFRAVGRYHIANIHDEAIKTHARDWSQFNPDGNADFYVRPANDSFARIGIKPSDGVERLVLFWEGAVSALGAGAGQTLAFRTGGNTRMQIGTEGRIRMFNLPTAPTGLSSGTLWRDGTTLRIVA